jgi:hypothetical protein
VNWLCPHCGESLVDAMFESINEKLEKIMSEDAAVQAVVTDEAASVSSFQAIVAALQAEVAAGTALQPATLEALQNGEAALDTLAQQAAADVAADEPAAPAEPAPPAS